MKIYYVLCNKSLPKTDQRFAVLVREGFVFSAFVFNVFWALYKKMWTAALGLLLIYAILDFVFLKTVANTKLYYLSHLWINVAFGCVANSLNAWYLEKRGYTFTSVAVGRDELEATKSFLTSFL